MRFPNNIVVKPVAGHEAAAIGQNVIGGIIDEVNFMAVVEDSKMKRDGTVYDQAAENYNSIARRRESRFMQMGDAAGPVMPRVVEELSGRPDRPEAGRGADEPAIYVYDKRLWDIRPERFGPERFRVFVGDETRQPRILTRRRRGRRSQTSRWWSRCRWSTARQFENDLLKSIRDIAGYSTQSLHPFMLNTRRGGQVLRAWCKSIISREACDFKTTPCTAFPDRIMNPDEPRFAHIDLAKSKDSAGVTHRPRAGLQAHEPRRLSGDAADHPVRLDPRSHAAAPAGRSSTRRSGECSTGCATS